MRKLLSRLRLVNTPTLAIVVGMLLVIGQSIPVTLAEQPPAIAGAILSPLGLSALHGILDSAHNADLRWPDFSFFIVVAIATYPRHWRSSTTICGIIVLETSATSILDCSTCSMI